MMGLASKRRATAVLVAAVVAASVLMGCRSKTKPPATKPTRATTQPATTRSAPPPGAPGAWGQGEADSPQAKPGIHWGRAHKGIVCGLAMDRPRYVVGQTVRMSIWLKNTRPQAVTCEVGRITSMRSLKNGCKQMYLIVDALGGQFARCKTVKVPGGGVGRILVQEFPTRPLGNGASDLHFVPGRTTVAVLCTPLFDKKVPLIAKTLPGATSGQAVVEVVPAIADAPKPTTTTQPTTHPAATQPAASVGKHGGRPAAGGHVAAPEKQAARWSKTVNGLQARLTLKRSQVLNGTPIIATYLNLRNVSDVGKAMKINWKYAKRTFRVVDEKGKELPTANGVFDGGTRLPGDTVLPPGGALTVNITQSCLGVSRDKAGLIDLGISDNWVFEHDGKDYYLQAVLEVPTPKAVKDDKTWGWHGRIEIPPVMLPLKPVPVDPAKVAELIQQLGSAMLATNTAASEKAARALSLIDDERVIPWYVKAVNTDSYSLKFTALDQLCRFKSDEALGGLKKGMTTQGSDFGNSMTDAGAASAAQNIRHSAACALSRSPHPEAIPLLLSMWNDRSDAVRITVLHALGKMDSQESLQMLKRMSKDSDEGVRNEALRYLKLRTTQPGPAATTRSAPPPGAPGAWGQGEADSPQARPGGWSNTIKGLRVRLVCDRGKFIVGKPIHVRLDIECTGVQPKDKAGCQLFPHVSFRLAKLTKRVKLPIKNRLVILKGKTFSRHFDVTKIHSLARPGRYVFVAGHENQTVEDVGDWTGDVQSPPVTIEVLGDTPGNMKAVERAALAAWEAAARGRRPQVPFSKRTIVARAQVTGDLPGRDVCVYPWSKDGPPNVLRLDWSKKIGPKGKKPSVLVTLHTNRPEPGDQSNSQVMRFYRILAQDRYLPRIELAIEFAAFAPLRLFRHEGHDFVWVYVDRKGGGESRILHLDGRTVTPIPSEDPGGKVAALLKENEVFNNSTRRPYLTASYRHYEKGTRRFPSSQKVFRRDARGRRHEVARIEVVYRLEKDVSGRPVRLVADKADRKELLSGRAPAPAELGRLCAKIEKNGTWGCQLHRIDWRQIPAEHKDRIVKAIATEQMQRDKHADVAMAKSLSWFDDEFVFERLSALADSASARARCLVCEHLPYREPFAARATALLERLLQEEATGERYSVPRAAFATLSKMATERARQLSVRYFLRHVEPYLDYRRVVYGQTEGWWAFLQKQEGAVAVPWLVRLAASEDQRLAQRAKSDLWEFASHQPELKHTAYDAMDDPTGWLKANEKCLRPWIERAKNLPAQLEAPRRPDKAGAAATQPATTRSAEADSSQAKPALPEPVLRGLGGRLAIRVEAKSWEALVKKVAPTFTWGGRDMMWIGKGQGGDPRFTMERAYVYQPAGKAPRWVLLEYKDARFGKWAAQIKGECIRRTAKLRASKPKSGHGSGNYAVVKDVTAKAGTVYEVGWQALMGGGVGLVVAERRLYLWHDADGKWHFLGEGPKESTGKMGYARMHTYRTESRVTWTGTPVKPAVKFTVTCTYHEWRTSDEPDFVPRRDRIQYSESVLDGPFPLTLRRTTRRPYMLAAKGETFDTLVQHLASWMSGPNRDGQEHRVRLWREALTRLNPKLPRGAIPKGTRIHVLTYAEVVDAMKKIRAGSARKQ